MKALVKLFWRLLITYIQYLPPQYLFGKKPAHKSIKLDLFFMFSSSQNKIQDWPQYPPFYFKKSLRYSYSILIIRRWQNPSLHVCAVSLSLISASWNTFPCVSRSSNTENIRITISHLLCPYNPISCASLHCPVPYLSLNGKRTSEYAQTFKSGFILLFKTIIKQFESQRTEFKRSSKTRAGISSVVSLALQTLNSHFQVCYTYRP